MEWLQRLVVVGVGLLLHGQIVWAQSPPGTVAGAASETPFPQLAQEEPLAEPTAGELRQLVGGLASESFAIRERSQAALRKYAEQHPLVVRKTLANDYVESLDPEVRYRLAEVLYDAVVDDMVHSGFLGIIMRPRNVVIDRKSVSCIGVDSILPNSAAARAGLQLGDEIIQVDNLTFNAMPMVRQQGQIPVQTSPNLLKFKTYIGGRKQGTEVTLKIRRIVDGKATIFEVPVRLGRRTRDLMEPEELRAEDEFFEKWLQQQAKASSSEPAPK